MTFQQIPVQCALDSEDDLYQMFATATARTRALLEMNSEEQRQAIRAAMAAELTKFQGVWFDGVSRSPSYLSTVGMTGTDAPLSDGRPSGRNACMVPMHCVVASGTKPL